jgi:hypothetical protein
MVLNTKFTKVPKKWKTKKVKFIKRLIIKQIIKHFGVKKGVYTEGVF